MLDCLDASKFTNLEWRLLTILAGRDGQPANIHELAQLLYVQGPSAEPGIVSVKICHLRKKMNRTRLEIRTTHGRGYSLHRREVKSDAA
jgi:DNA-binding response OmpR family regulator